MNRPSFPEGVIVAIVVSVLAGGVYTVVGYELGRIAALYTLISLVGGVYFSYLLIRAPERAGRITAALLWIAMTAGLLLTGAPLWTLALAQLGFIWAFRSLYYYDRIVAGLADSVLCALSVVAAAWAMLQTNSVFAAFWCLMLTQALFVFIRSAGRWSGASQGSSIAQADRGADQFTRAYECAQQALRAHSTARTS